jgi:STE24 endopeptidase
MFRKTVFLILILIVGCMSLAAGQTEPKVPIASENSESFDVDLATKKYLDSLTPEQKSRSDAYFEGGYWIILWDFVAQVIIAWIFLYLGLSKWIKKVAAKTNRKNIQNLIYIILYFLFSFLITFPYRIYTGFIREHEYGLSNMTFSKWASEEMISSSLSLLFAGILIMLIYMIMRKIINNWWIWGSGIFIVFAIFLLFIGPVYISPIFNDYKPLEEGPLKEEILSLAKANGVPVTNVYQFDASKQSKRISANVSGLGSTIRVSLNDNLIRQCTPAEIKAVMAHELGHYVLNHMYKMLIDLIIVIIAGFALANFLMKKLIASHGSGWGIKDLSEISSLPLFVLVFAFFMFIATPVLNNISRITETEADIFGLNAAREPDGFASVSMKLSEYRKIDPGNLEEIIFFDHPSGRKRVSVAMKWKAQNLK